MDSVDDSEKFVGLVTNLPLTSILIFNNFFVNDLKRKVKIIDNVAFNDEVKRHVLTHFPNFLRNPFMKTSNGVAFEILRLDLASWKIDVLDRSSFVFFFFLHLFLRNLKSDNKIWSLRGKYFVDMLIVEIFSRVVIAFEAKHEFSFLFD